MVIDKWLFSNSIILSEFIISFLVLVEHYLLFIHLINSYWYRSMYSFSSVQSLSLSDSLRPRGLQHTRLPVHHQLPEFTQTHVH